MAGPQEGHRITFRADCQRCVGLCCVAPAFMASSDFAITKPAATACPNLAEDFGCGIHSDLRAAGFPGCSAYDCFGAGQQVTQVTFAGRSWRDSPDLAAQMFGVFAAMSDLYELLWYLHEALLMPAARSLHDEVRRMVAELQSLTAEDPPTLVDLDPTRHRQRVNALLLDTSRLVRGAAAHDRDLSRSDLIGADLRGHDLRGAMLFGARCIGADLSGADLSGADLRGTDLRGADLSSADLTDAIFLIQAQADAAQGDHLTRLPGSVTRPAHWAGSAAT